MVRKTLRKILFAANGGTVLINGERFRIHPDLLSYFNVRSDNPSEPTIHQFLKKFLSDGDVFVDVGANAGFMSAIASRAVGKEGKVISFEPNPVTALYANYTLANNVESKNYSLLQVALSDKRSFMSMAIGNDDSQLMEKASIVYREVDARNIEVLVLRIDDLLSDIFEKPVLLKIDVEGAELAVLTGAIEFVRNNRPYISLEVHGLYFDDPGKHVKQVFSFCEENNFVPVNIVKKKVETFDDFMADDGMGKKNDQGYGNLILVPTDSGVSKVMSCLI